MVTPIANAQQAQTITQEAPEYQNYQQSNDQSDQLAKLLEIPEVRAVYDQCNELKSTGVELELSECLWNGKQDIVGIGSNDTVRDKITSKLSEIDQEDQKKYESVNVIPLSKKTSEAQKKLEEFYYKRLNQQIFGESSNGKASDGSYKIIDHSRFNTIYQNQLTKNVLTAISSFCIEAEIKGSGPNLFPLISKDKKKRDERRKKNIKELSTTQLTLNEGETNEAVVAGVNYQSNNWQNCFMHAQYVCHGGKKNWTNPKTDQVEQITAKQAMGVDSCSKKKTECKTLIADYDYTKTRACELTNYLKTAKQNLKATKAISEGFKELGKGGGTRVVATGENFNPNQNLISSNTGLNIDEITSVSSNELVNESGFSEGVNNDLADLEKCVVKDAATGEFVIVPGAEEECKKYLNTDREQVEELKAEYALRLRGLTDKAKEIDLSSEDTKGVEGFLKDQGYTDDSISETIEANTDIKALKAQIIARYENEKLELIKSMNKRIEDRASSNAGTIDITPGSSDIEKLGRIHEELSSKTEQYAQLIHFNNVVSGFLEIGEGEDARMNTASIQREIANSAFSEKNLEGSSMADAYANQTENLEKSLEANKIELSEKDKDSGTDVTLDIKQINNELLNYDTGASQ